MLLKRMSYISLACALIVSLTFLYLPTPWGIPITGQTLALLVTGLILLPLDAFLAVALYLTMGIIGLPVFSGAQSGLGVLCGPTGGYLSSFLLAVSLLSWFNLKKKPLLGTVLFTITVYLFGSLQLSVVTSSTFLEAIKIGMLPFLPGDLLKIYLALKIAKRINYALPKYTSLEQ